jgi:glycosyltransferase involved in cell wall biosynthesis
LRILIVNTRHFPGGGDSTYTFNLANLLRAKGHEVGFFAMQDERNIFDPNADLFVSHIDFNELNRNKTLLNGFRVACRVFYSTEARRKFSRLLQRFHPDIIHLQNMMAHITSSVIFEAKKHGLPVVWTVHDYGLICPNSHFIIDKTGAICEACDRNSFYQAALKRCKKGSLLASAMAAIDLYFCSIVGLKRIVDFLLAPSMFLRAKMIDRGFRPQQVKHLPLFLPDNMFSKPDGDKGYLLFMGRLETIKGIIPLLNACRLVPEINLVLAGSVREPLSSQLPRLLPSNATYVGMVPRDELQRILLQARAVVVPSLNYENQPFSILESFAAGKPVIASNLGGMSELVRPSKAGLLVQPGDVNALAEAMRWMVKHPAEAHLMGTKAHEYARRIHNSETHYQKLIEIYKCAKGRR